MAELMVLRLSKIILKQVLSQALLPWTVKLPSGSVPGEVAEDIIFRLGIVDGPLAMIGGIIAGFVYFGYRLDKSTHQRIRQLLEARANGA